MRVVLFITCLADAMFPDVGRATVTVLERLGHQVDFPAAQTCCGQMHVNTGYQKQALPLVERFASVFAPYDVVVAPSGSCVGSIRHQHRMIAERFGRPDLVGKVEVVAAKTFELSELLEKLSRETLGDDADAKEVHAEVPAAAGGRHEAG